MKITEISSKKVEALINEMNENDPVVMLNLVRYNSDALYEDSEKYTTCSGAEAYLKRYATAFNAIAANEGITEIKVKYIGDVKGLLCGREDEQWDAIVLVEYPNLAAFRKITESSEYEAKAEPHRKAALQDWRLIATVSLV
ncbi:DUF1330 domain-containing protein [Pedobacter frigidisoli]|uniref:DUF1330 domain-containing protein n=1 Tax=Pedobacter frigidisoli TaxID=2530455 RepID=A0A4R0NGV1_9SPHI|nr:DUF1330 domain-containing protein [Pedobacter frigidisoli]TCC97964.1 DUF1330 domain-containing protein [Pedobacter frigidisoli]